MRKILIIGLVLIISLALTVGCNPFSDDLDEYTIDSAIETIENANYEVKNRTENYYSMIGASDGANVDIGENEISVELYIDSGDIQESMFEDPDEGKQAFNASNLYVYIHSDDEEIYSNLKSILTEKY